jgi:hypothetical protein
MSVTAQFVKAFDPTSEAHFTWFQKMTLAAETMERDLVKEINTNPMNIHVSDQDALDWFHIHFVLCACYSKAVCKGTAFVPKF